MLKELAQKFQGKKILVIGDVVLDEYWYGAPIVIAENNPAIRVREKKYGIGAAANVAFNIKKLGGIPYLASVIGNDRAGRKIIDLMKDVGLVVDYMFIDSKRITTVKTRSVCDNKIVFRHDHETTEEVSNIHFLNSIDETFDAIILSDYDKGVITDEVYNWCVRKNVPIILDPKKRMYFYDIHYLKPNLKELEVLSGVDVSTEEGILEASKKLCIEMGVKKIFTTAGEKGIYLYDGKLEHIAPVKSRTVFDFVGAGDTSAAALSLGVAVGASSQDIAHLMNHASGVVVQKFGVSTVDISELLKDLE